MKTGTLSAAVILLGLGIVSTASAKTAPPAPLQVEKFGNIPYISGGVGADERDRLRSISRSDNLRLSFALQNGEYLGGADVKIKDNSGKEILDATADGPLFFAQLPAGIYMVDATAMGQTLTRSVNIPAKGQAPIFFTWQSGVERQARN